MEKSKNQNTGKNNKKPNKIGKFVSKVFSRPKLNSDSDKKPKDEEVNI